MALDPENLTPEASINRVRIVDLPGVALPHGIRGKTAYELCSLPSFLSMIRESAEVLRLTPEEFGNAANLPRVLADRLTSDEARVVEAVESICARYAESLGYVIATLKRGDAANREARPEWDESYWLHWGRMERVVLGGGLANGALGEAIVRHVNPVLEVAGVLDCEVRLSEYPSSLLPLIGLARTSMATEQATLVFDFGQTNVKSGLAHYEMGRLARLETFPLEPAFADDFGLAPKMAALIASRVAGATPGSVSSTVALSIASYVRNNHPFQYSRSGYARLWSFTDNLGRWLGERISGLTQREVATRLEHDCTAAAQTYAGEPDTAVIMLGTALGAGFGSRVRPHLPLAPAFEVVDSER